ncbi:beta-ketoacyl synthase N-terminal-like domain-containing protein [Nocardia sp. NPDC051570]|uniref:beta-ketoacyl synthase N-terminal-like domain-containing protein n=1 Tax=Nocardia sp. NPDC051570 TaxID=3364324 RepID=UPI0037950DA7
MTAVITGIGVWTSSGKGHKEFWETVCAGTVTLSELTRFDRSYYPFTRAGQLRDHEATDIPPRLLAQTDVWTRQGLEEGALALADAGLDLETVAEYGAGVSLASSAGGVEFGQREINALWAAGPHHVSAYQSIAWFYAATTGQTSIHHRIRGQCDAVVAEGAGGLDALAVAGQALDDGTSSIMLCGGTDSALSPYGMVCQWSSGLLSGRAYLPFQDEADGWVPGEGGAVLVAETLDAARLRSAEPYGSIAGYGASIDPSPGSERPSSLRVAIRQALAQARVRPDEIDVVFADAAAVAGWDSTESEALATVFGPRKVPVTAPKSGYGRLYSGGGAVDVATALLAMRHGVIPPAPHRPPAHPALDLVNEAREARLSTALVVARGYGGFNSALVLKAPNATLAPTE